MLAATIVATSAEAATIRDRAGIFGKDAVQKAHAQLDQVEQATGIPIVIETIDAIPGLDKGAPRDARRKAIDALAVERDRAIRDEGIYILISKRDRVISHVLIREHYANVLPIEKRDAIEVAFLKEFGNHENYDGGLLNGAKAIEQALAGVSAKGAIARAGGAHAPVPNRAAGGQVAAGHSTIGTFLLILAGILGVLLILKLVGSLFGRSAGAGYPGPQGGMGMPRPGMGGGPGYYGGPGYGGRGGGFFSGLLGGLGGAVAGNWLYDQFSGRHGNVHSADAVSPTDYSSGSPDQGSDAIIGAGDDPGGGASWDDGGGGADVGGGDWAGGGGDWGGGGGDWGGGGGGGDW